jgi:branched-chain amino acid transport system permease protein
VTWVNAVVQGVLLGGLYALLACGLSLLFGVMRIINIAHGDFAVLGAFGVWVVVDETGVSPFVALLPVLVAMAAIGWVLQRGLLERSIRSGVLVPLLTTFGLSVVLQNLLLEIFSADTKSLHTGALETSRIVITDDVSLPGLGLVSLGTAVVLLGGLQLLLSRTSLGRAMRATAQDPDTAELVGIDTHRVYARAAALALATAALAGAFVAMRSSFDPASGPTQLIYAFEAVVIGGLGSLWGTLAGGIVLGVAQTIGARIDPQYFAIAGHLIFLAVLASPRGAILARGTATA